MPGLHINKFSPLIQRDNFAVDHRFVRHPCECLRDGRVLSVEVIIVPGAQMHPPARLERNGSESVEFQLFCGVGRYVALGTEANGGSR